MEKEITLKEVAGSMASWFRYFKSHKRSIFIAAIAGALIGAGYSWFKKPVFTATSTFVLEEDKGAGSLGQYAGLASLVGIDLGMGNNDLFQGENITALYRSRTMLESVLRSKATFKGKETLLIDAYAGETGLRKKWARREKFKDLHFQVINGQAQSRLADSLLGEVIEDIDRKYLQVGKVDKRMNVIGVSFTTCNEELAKLFNRTLVAKVNQFYIQTKTKKSLDNIKVLQHQTDSVKAVMDGAILEAARVVDITPNLNITRQSQRTSPVQRSQFNAEANKEILKELVKNLELSKMTLLKNKPLIQLIDEPVYPIRDKKPGMVKMALLGFVLGIVFILFALLFRRVWIRAMNDDQAVWKG